MSPLGWLLTGLSIGSVFGGLACHMWWADHNIYCMAKMRFLREAADRERRRARNLHRRAQKAEGRLQRINRFMSEGEDEC